MALIRSRPAPVPVQFPVEFQHASVIDAALAGIEKHPFIITKRAHSMAPAARTLFEMLKAQLAESPPAGPG